MRWRCRRIFFYYYSPRCLYLNYRGVQEKGLLSVHSLCLHYLSIPLHKKSAERTLFRKPSVSDHWASKKCDFLHNLCCIHLCFMDNLTVDSLFRRSGAWIQQLQFDLGLGLHCNAGLQHLCVINAKLVILQNKSKNENTLHNIVFGSY